MLNTASKPGLSGQKAIGVKPRKRGDHGEEN